MDMAALTRSSRALQLSPSLAERVEHGEEVPEAVADLFAVRS